VIEPHDLQNEPGHRVRRACLALFALATALHLAGCSDMPKQNVDHATMTELASCPSSPNCVCSCDTDESHGIAPITIAGDPDAAWQALKGILEDTSRIEITASGERYIHAVATTRILRFKDDIEFLLDRETGRIEMRSASRVGYSDFGTNRRRMEDLRERMVEAGASIDGM
jgi:uncharacterized protein (DUF1499 family)